MMELNDTENEVHFIKNLKNKIRRTNEVDLSELITDDDEESLKVFKMNYFQELNFLLAGAVVAI